MTDAFLKLTKENGKSIIIRQSSIISIDETDKGVIVTYSYNGDIAKTIKCLNSLKSIEEHIMIPTIISDPYNPYCYDDDDEDDDDCGGDSPVFLYDDDEDDDDDMNEPFAPPF